MHLRRRRHVPLVAAAAIMGSLPLALIASVATAPSASADTTQNNGCASVTPGITQFAVPITGTAAPNPDTLPAQVTLSNTSVTISVDSTLIGAGVATGLVSAADSLADLGVTANDGTPNQNAGINAVVANTGGVTLKITGSHTSEGTQTASNSAPVNVTFYTTADSLGGSVVVYTSVTNPPVLGGPNVSDPTRTGTVLTGSLSVPIPLGNTTWTPTGGNVVFSEASVVPSSLTTPTTADKSAAPLIVLMKIDGAVSVGFWCWPGTQSPAPPASGTALVPGASSAIDTVTVIAPPTAPVCQTPQAASVGGLQAVVVTPNCTDVNGNFTPSGTSIALTGTPPASGTVVVNPDGTITYSNTDANVSADSFQYTATDDTSLTSNTVTVNVAIFGNQCTANPSCSLHQVIVAPVAPSTLSMTETALTALGNPDFTHAVLGGFINNSNACVPGPLTLNGGPQDACGIMNSVTVVNARGTDNQWDLTGQVTDFIDGTRGPADTCSATNNISQVPPNNHCIPGDNLGWVPEAQIIDPSVPGDTAAINAGGIILPPATTAQTPPAFPPSPLTPRTNSNSVLSPYSILNLSTPGPGLHDAAQELCGAPVNQSGGTFQCDAGLLLAVPGSAAAGTYTATLTLTLS